jgi:Ser/Thr protein kinase RdoA (MazF antagonist)
MAAVAGRAERRRALASLGAAVATFHRLPVPEDATFDRFGPHRLLSAAELISSARPDVAVAAHRLAALLERDLPGPDVAVCLHGDLHPKNAVLLGERVGLIDLDQASGGPAAAELGGLLAGLRLDRLIGRLDPGEQRRLRDALLAGYSSVRPLPADAAILWHTSAALLVERAARAVSRLRTLTLRHLAVLLEDAERTLA